MQALALLEVVRVVNVGFRMKNLVYTACAVHVMWIVGSYIYDMLLGDGMQIRYFYDENMEMVSRKMDRFWKSNRFRQAKESAIKLYKDIYTKPEHALVAFKGKRKKHEKNGVILCCK